MSSARRPTYLIDPQAIHDITEFCRDVIAAKDKRSGDRYNWDGAERRLMRNIEGYMGEYAASYHYGVEFKGEVRAGCGDDGFDLELGGKRLGIKATSNKRGCLLVKRGEARNPKTMPVAYLLCLVDIEKGRVELRGVADRDRVLAAHPLRRMVEGGPLNHVLSQEELRPPRGARQERGGVNPSIHSTGI